MTISIALALPVALFALSLAIALTVPSDAVQNILRPYESSIPQVPDSQIGYIKLKKYSSLELFQNGCFALSMLEAFRFVLSTQLVAMHLAYEERVEHKQDKRREKRNTARQKRVAKHMDDVRKRAEKGRTSSLETVLAEARARKEAAEREEEDDETPDIDLEQAGQAEEPLLKVIGPAAWERTGEEISENKSSWFSWSSSSKKKTPNRGSIN
jgi:hypothetical protein